MTCGAPECQRERHRKQCRALRERDSGDVSHHYRDVVEPFRQRHPSYQRRHRLRQRLGEIREKMGDLGRAAAALWKRATALAAAAGQEAAHSKETTALWLTRALGEAARWASELASMAG